MVPNTGARAAHVQPTPSADRIDASHTPMAICQKRKAAVVTKKVKTHLKAVLHSQQPYVTCLHKQRLLREQPLVRGDARVSLEGGPCAGKGGMLVPRGLSLGQPDPAPAICTPTSSSFPARSSGFPPGGQGSCLLSQRPHLERILFITLVAVSQAPVPLIPQSPVRAVNKDSNLFIKNRLPSQQASWLLPVLGDGGVAGSEPSHPRPLQGRAPPALVTRPLTPRVTRRRPGTVWGQAIRQLPPAACRLCGHPINAHSSIRHQVPMQTTAHPQAFTVVKTHRPPPPHACRSHIHPACLGIPGLSLELLRPTLIQGRSLLCCPISAQAGLVHQGTGNRAWGGRSPHKVTHQRGASRPLVPAPLVTS